MVKVFYLWLESFFLEKRVLNLLSLAFFLRLWRWACKWLHRSISNKRWWIFLRYALKGRGLFLNRLVKYLELVFLVLWTEVCQKVKVFNPIHLTQIIFHNHHINEILGELWRALVIWKDVEKLTRDIKWFLTFHRNLVADFFQVEIVIKWIWVKSGAQKVNLFNNCLSLLSSDINIWKVDIVIWENVSWECFDHTVKFINIYPNQSVLVFELIYNYWIIKQSLCNIRVQFMLTILSFLTYFLQDSFFTDPREQLGCIIRILVVRWYH